jgi:hypothetical protein
MIGPLLFITFFLNDGDCDCRLNDGVTTCVGASSDVLFFYLSKTKSEIYFAVVSFFYKFKM